MWLSHLSPPAASSCRSSPQPHQGLASLWRARLASVVSLGTNVVTVDLFQTGAHELADLKCAQSLVERGTAPAPPRASRLVQAFVHTLLPTSSRL